MRWWTWALCAAAALAACTETNSSPKESAMTQAKAPSADELAKLRTEVLAVVKPFAGHAEYAVTDPEIVDPCIKDRMRGLGDRMPTASERADFVRNTAVCVENALTTPDGLARVAKRIADRYDHPVITRDGDRVTIDAGVVAGKLHVFRGVVEVFDTPLVDAGQWATPEVVKFLKLGIARFPDARTYTAQVEIPKRSTAPEWRYTFDRGEDRIRVEAKSQPGLVYVSEKLGGDVGNARSLLMTALHQEKLEQPPPWR